MPKFGPIKRNDLIFYLRKNGFTRPFSSGKHQFMIKESIRLTLPNPHRGDISKDLLSKILKQAKIEKNNWENL